MMKTYPYKITNASSALANCKLKNPTYNDKQQLIVIPNNEQNPTGLCNKTLGGDYFDMGYTGYTGYDCCVPKTEEDGVRNSCININPGKNPRDIKIINDKPTADGCNKSIGTLGWYDNGNDSFPDWTCCVKEPVYFPMYLSFANFCKPHSTPKGPYQGSQSVCKPFVYGGTIWVTCPSSTGSGVSIKEFQDSITVIAKTGQVKNVILAVSPPPIDINNITGSAWTPKWVTDNLNLMDKCVSIMNKSTLNLLAFSTLEERHLGSEQRRLWNARFNANLRMKHPDVKQIYIGLADTTSTNITAYIKAVYDDDAYPKTYTGPVFDWIGMDYYPGPTNTFIDWKKYQDKYNKVALDVGSKVLIIPYIGNSTTVKANGGGETTPGYDKTWNMQIKNYMETENKKLFLITMVIPYIFGFDPLPTQKAITNDVNIQYILKWKKETEDQHIYPKLTKKPAYYRPRINSSNYSKQ